MPPRLTGHSCVPLDVGLETVASHLQNEQEIPHRRHHHGSTACGGAFRDSGFDQKERCDGLGLPLYEEGSRLGAPRNAEFLKHIREVIFDRFVTEPQGARDFFVRLSLSHQCEDTLFL
jgi:hypothetical protein